MAKNQRPSSVSGVTMGYTKRGRNIQSGKLMEITETRYSPGTAIFEFRELDGTVTSKKVFRSGRVIRDAKGETMVEAVMHAAADEGLTVSKDGRIAGRVSSELIAKAKARTGIASDTDLLEFALANVALEDNFAEAFHAVRGTVDPDLDFGI